MVLGLAVAALAGAPEEVREAVGRWPDAPVVLSCAPASSVSDALALLPSALGDAEMPELLRNLTEGTEAGLDPGGAVTLVRDGEQGLRAMRIGFSGTNEEAQALLGRLDPDVTGGDGHWQLVVEDRTTFAVLSDGTLELSTGARPQPGTGQAEPLLTELPTGAGCAAFMTDPSVEDVSVDAVSLFLPMEGGGPLLVRMRTGEPLPAALGVTGATIPIGQVPIAPSTVVTLSSSTDGVLAGLAAAEEGLDADAVLDDLHQVVRMPDGASIAFVGDPQAGAEWVGMVRILDPDGEPLKPRKLVRMVLRQARGLPTQRLDKDAFAVLVGPQPVFVRVSEDGRVAFASTPDLALGAFGPEGTPWLDEAGVARAQGAPVMLQSLEPGMEAQVAMRPHADAIEFAIQLGGDPADREWLQAGLSPLVSWLLPAILMGPQPEPDVAGPPQG